MSDLVRDQIAAELAAISRVARLPEPDDYGTDLKCLDDLTIALDETTGLESFAQDIYHRVTTPKGGNPDDLDFGEAAQQLLSVGMTATDLGSVAGILAGEVEKDDRVAHGGAHVVIDPMADGRSMLVRISVQPEDPAAEAFDLILVVTDGAALLQAIETER